MSESPITTEDPEQAVTEWFDRLGDHCAAGEYDAAREIVAEDVLSFGTSADVVRGVDKLQGNQWESIWPYIDDFGFDHETIHAFGGDGHAWGVATWASTGYTEDGEPFHRPGRATVVLDRRDGEWLAVHTHFSLDPGTPQETYGPAGRE